MGKLYLPSLEGKKFIEVSNVSQAEAATLVAEFDKRVEAKRKMHNLNQETASMVFYGNQLNSVDYDSVELNDEPEKQVAEQLYLSNFVGVRGARAVFVELDADLIEGYVKSLVGIGTTVVYNDNRATSGFSDPNVLNLISVLELSDNSW